MLVSSGSPSTPSRPCTSDVVGDPHAHGPLLRVHQPPRHLAGRGQDERVRPRGRRLDRPERGVLDVHELPELGEVPAHQREVVLLVEPPDPQDPVPTVPVAEHAAERIARVRRVGDQRPVPQRLGHLLEQAGLRVVGMDVDEAGHLASLGGRVLAGDVFWFAPVVEVRGAPAQIRWSRCEAPRRRASRPPQAACGPWVVAVFGSYGDGYAVGCGRFPACGFAPVVEVRSRPRLSLETPAPEAGPRTRGDSLLSDFPSTPETAPFSGPDCRWPLLEWMHVRNRCNRSSGRRRGPRRRPAPRGARTAQARRPRRRAGQAPAGRPVVRAAPRDRRHRRRDLGRRLPAGRAAVSTSPWAGRAPRRSPRSPPNRSPPTLGISTAAGMRLIADALDLQHRLPRIWRLVETARRSSRGRPARSPRPPTPCRRRPRRTWTSGSPRSCPRAGSATIQTAVAHGDREVPPRAPRAAGEDRASKGWHVTLHHPAPGDYAGTSYLDVAGDTLDLTAFHDLVCDQAAQLKALGDTDDLEVRKAKALGVIASQQATLDLLTLTGDASSAGEPGGRAVETTRARKPKTRLYLHLTLADLASAPRRRRTAVGEVERLGPATLDQDQGVGRPLPGHHPPGPRPRPHRRRRRARPARLDARARHPPRRPLRLPLVHRRRPPLRPRPHRPLRPDRRGRTTGPDQHPTTSPRLCRRHHRCKTSGRWRYRRRDPTAPMSGTAPTAAATSSPRTAPCNFHATDRNPPTRTRLPREGAGPPARLRGSSADGRQERTFAWPTTRPAPPPSCGWSCPGRRGDVPPHARSAARPGAGPHRPRADARRRDRLAPRRRTR